MKIAHPAATDAFGDIFRRLVRCFQPRGLDAGSLDAIARRSRVNSYRDPARECGTHDRPKILSDRGRMDDHRARGAANGGCELSGCARCGGRGLVRVDYETGEPFDLAICRCEAGKAYRRGGAALVRMRFELYDSHYVAPIEDFEGEV
jgi:hypothetical protein